MPTFLSDISMYTLVGMIAMSVSMAIIPLAIKLAPLIGMVDAPDARKVHQQVIPRIGGVGIVIGLITPLLIWLPLDDFLTSVLFGVFILLVFGAWDDIKDLGPYVKLFGQFLAAISVVYYGDVYVHHFPFLGLEELPEYIGKPFTVIAIVTVINALNLSDGLDGLAGGEALLTLAAVVYMAYLFDGVITIHIAIATIGGIFGFLRFNSYPAKVFMGDSGSQALGFIVGVLVVYLTQNVNPVVSPVVPLLLIGLPVIDAFVVFYLRARRGDSLVVAAKDHLHHRLLEMGFYHYESVAIIYSIQILFVVLAILMPYESDGLILSIYIGICSLLFFSIAFAEKIDFVFHKKTKRHNSIFLALKNSRYASLTLLPCKTIEIGLSSFLIAAAMMSEVIPFDFAVSAITLLCLLVLSLATKWLSVYVYRLVMFVTIGFSVYLLSTYTPEWLLEQAVILYIYFILMGIAAFVCARFMAKGEFNITPLDYLMVLMVLASAMLPETAVGESNFTWMVIQIVILFYACELVIQKTPEKVSVFVSTTTLLVLSFLALRGLL